MRHLAICLSTILSAAFICAVQASGIKETEYPPLSILFASASKTSSEFRGVKKKENVRPQRTKKEKSNLLSREDVLSDIEGANKRLAKRIRREALEKERDQNDRWRASDIFMRQNALKRIDDKLISIDCCKVDRGEDVLLAVWLVSNCPGDVPLRTLAAEMIGDYDAKLYAWATQQWCLGWEKKRYQKELQHLGDH
jgi:hypothetical protein